MIATAARSEHEIAAELSADGISVDLGGRRVLDRVSLSFPADGMVAVVGPNGSGKSTLIRTLAGLIRPREGEVRIGGRAIGSIQRKRLAGLQGLLVQSADTPALTTVREHVALGRHAHARLFGAPRSGDREHVAAAMERCGVSAFAERRVEELSGGERQRVRLATLLAQDPRIMLLDEPLTGLDIEHQLALLHLLTDLHREDGRTIVCVLHDLDLALRYFPRVVVMHRGRAVADGRPHDVLCPQLFADVFRVEARIDRATTGRAIVLCDRPMCGAQRLDGAASMIEPKMSDLTIGRRSVQSVRADG